MLSRYSLILGLFPILCFPPGGGAAEPNIKIRLLTGSEIRADRAWVQGDRLLYERYGTTGTVRMVDVAGLIDRELEVLVAACVARMKDAQVNLAALDRAAKARQDQSATPEERAAAAPTNGAAQEAADSVLKQFQMAVEAAKSGSAEPQVDAPRVSRRQQTAEQLKEVSERPFVRRAIELFDVAPGQSRYSPPEND